MMQQGYTSLPAGPWRSSTSRRRHLTMNGVLIPLVPTLCFLACGIGLPMWAVSMLQARTTIDAISADMGLLEDSINRLKAKVLAAVLVVVPLVAMILGCNMWLETVRSAQPGHTETPEVLARYTSFATKVNAANWLLLLLTALNVAGTFTWQHEMATALSAVQQAGGDQPPWGPPDTAVAAAAAPPSLAIMLPQALVLPYIAGTSVAVVQRQQPNGQPHSESLPPQEAPGTAAAQQRWRRRDGFSDGLGATWQGEQQPCPSGCIDLGTIARIFGLPGHCLCGGALVFGDLAPKLQQMVQQLSIAVAGAALLFLAASWTFGYLTAQKVHAERDLQEAVQKEWSSGTEQVAAPLGAAV